MKTCTSMSGVNRSIPKHDNNFDILRLFAAATVLFWHSFCLYDNLNDPIAPFSHDNIRLEYIALAIFFLISGYLVTASFLSNKGLKYFALNRALRIVPAIVVYVLLVTVIIGPIVSEFGLKQYFSDKLTWKYLNTALIMPLKYFLPGVFVHNPYKDVVNGSLWSLELEVKCYIMLALLGICRLIRPRVFLYLSALLLIVYIAASKTFQSPKYILGMKFLDILHHSQWFYFFIVGGLYYLLKDRIKYNHAAAFILLVAMLILAPSQIFGALAFMLIFPYLIFYLALGTKPISNKLLKGNDISYGLYIYGWPVQQIYMQYIGHAYGFNIFVLCAFIGAIICGILSWKFIERPFLLMKNRSRTSVKSQAE